MLQGVEDIAVAVAVVVAGAGAVAAAVAAAVVVAVDVVVIEATPKVEEDQNFSPIFSSILHFLFQWKLVLVSDLRVQT